MNKASTADRTLWRLALIWLSDDYRDIVTLTVVVSHRPATAISAGSVHAVGTLNDYWHDNIDAAGVAESQHRD